MKRVIKRLYASWITRYWPVRDNLRGSHSSPHPLRAHRGILQHIGRSIEEKNVLRCSGTPRISGKLFTGLSVGRTAALCIIVIQTGKQTHAHTPAAPWAHHSPSVPCRGEKKKLKSAGVEARLCRSATSSSLLPFLFPVMLSTSCRAELFWSESDRLPCPFSAAGAAGSDVTAAATQ